jgi:hypothetical protein
MDGVYHLDGRIMSGGSAMRSAAQVSSASPGRAHRLPMLRPLRIVQDLGNGNDLAHGA